MVRFLRSTCDDFDTEDELERFLFTEKTLALLYVVATISFAAGALAGAGVVPYASAYEWNLLLVSSGFHVFINARDASYAVETFFSARTETGKRAAYSANGKLRGTISGQMHMFSALMMTMGSVSLLNASIIAILQKMTAPSEMCRRQYALAFMLHLIGSAGNNVMTGSDLCHIHSTRLLLNFQDVIASAALFVSGILMLPNLNVGNDNMFHKGAIVLSTTLGSVLAVLSAVMHYFYMIAFSWTQRDYYEKRTYEIRMEQQPSLQEITEDPSTRGYLRRLRDVIRTKGKTLIWSAEPEEVDLRSYSQELSQASSEAELLMEETSDDDVDADSLASARSSTFDTASSEEDRIRPNRVVRFGT